MAREQELEAEVARLTAERDALDVKNADLRLGARMMLDSLGEYVRQSMYSNPEWSDGIQALEAAIALPSKPAGRVHCPSCICGRRAPVQASGNLGTHRDGTFTKSMPGYGPGTVAWFEFLLAMSAYAKEYGTGQSPERMAQRGGLSYGELTDLLGHAPTTWEPIRG